MAFTVNHLTGRARLWGTTEWERYTPACATFQSFASEVRKVFSLSSTDADIAWGLMQMCQNNQTARQNDWKESALRDAFLHGLAHCIKDELVTHDLAPTLDALIELAIRIDLRFQARRRERRHRTASHLTLWILGSTSSSCFHWSSSRGGGANAVGTHQTDPQGTGKTTSKWSVPVLWQPGHFIAQCPAKGLAHH